jgi:hypothetical protein
MNTFPKTDVFELCRYERVTPEFGDSPALIRTKHALEKFVGRSGMQYEIIAFEAPSAGVPGGQLFVVEIFAESVINIQNQDRAQIVARPPFAHELLL